MTSVTKYLLSQRGKIDIDATDSNGNSPLTYAIENKKWHIVDQMYVLHISIKYSVLTLSAFSPVLTLTNQTQREYHH